MMRYSLIMLFTGVFLSGCFNSSQKQENACTVKWQLVEMTGNMANVAPLKGEDMSWQELYTLNADSTFTKERRGEKQLQASGRYKFVNIGEEQFIEFQYEAATEIIGSCLGDNKETLRLSNGKLYGTWQACDGPGLTYERMTVDCED